MSVTIVMKPALSASAPIVAHDLKKLRVNPNAWDILPDGRLLAIQRGEGEDDITEFTSFWTGSPNSASVWRRQWMNEADARQPFLPRRMTC